MTYNVFSGMLSPTQSMNHYFRSLCWMCFKFTVCCKIAQFNQYWSNYIILTNKTVLGHMFES